MLTVGIFNAVQAQITEIESEEKSSGDDKKAPVKNRFVVGGNLSANFGNFTFVEVSPLAGYRLNNYLTAGVGFTYQYISVNDPYGIYLNYKENVWGARLFVQQKFFYGLFAHAEFEELWVDFKTTDPPVFSEKDVFPGVPLGLGYDFTDGSNVSSYILVLYNVLYVSDPDRYTNPYVRPWIVRFGFLVGL